MLLNHLLLTIGLFINVVNCHNYAMVCNNDKTSTGYCQGRHGYYCNSKGYTFFSIRNDPRCDEFCECIDLMPKPGCIAWMGTGSMGCIRDGLIDPSTLFKNSDGHRDEATTDVLQEIHLKEQERQLLGRDRLSLKEDKGQKMDKPYKRASLSNQESQDDKADSHKEERQQPTPFNTANNGPTAQETATATTTPQPGQQTNCTDAECCIKKFAQAKNQAQPSTVDEPKPELDPYIKGFLASIALQHPRRDTDRGGGGGHGGGGHGSGGGRGGGGSGGKPGDGSGVSGGGAAAAAGAGSRSTASIPMTLQHPVWLCSKVLVGIAVSALIRAV